MVYPIVLDVALVVADIVVEQEHKPNSVDFVGHNAHYYIDFLLVPPDNDLKFFFVEASVQLAQEPYFPEFFHDKNLVVLEILLLVEPVGGYKSSLDVDTIVVVMDTHFVELAAMDFLDIVAMCFDLVTDNLFFDNCLAFLFDLRFLIIYLSLKAVRISTLVPIFSQASQGISLLVIFKI